MKSQPTPSQVDGSAQEKAVPQIFIEGGEVRSDAKTPAHIADTCACWPDESVKLAKRLLRKEIVITCLDATAHAAITSLAISVIGHSGRHIKARIEKGYESPSPVVAVSPSQEGKHTPGPICSTYTSNGCEGDIPCEHCGNGPDAHERKARYDSYPERLEALINPAVKVVFAKNAEAPNGYDCWMEGRKGKPVSGHAVNMFEFALLEKIFTLTAQAPETAAERDRLREALKQAIEGIENVAAQASLCAIHLGVLPGHQDWLRKEVRAVATPIIELARAALARKE